MGGGGGGWGGGGPLTTATSVRGQNRFAARSAQLPTLAGDALFAGEDWCGGVAAVILLR